MGPVRLQLSRKKGFALQALSLATNGLPAVVVTRPRGWGNPFRVGGYFLMGDPGGHAGPFRMSYCEASPEYADARFTKIADRSMAVDWYRRYIAKHPLSNIADLRGKNLACACPLGEPCHADVLLELAAMTHPNSPGQ